MDENLLVSVSLWFDVGIKRYTTFVILSNCLQLLWFDVGIKRYTTAIGLAVFKDGCGLM